MFKIIKNIQFIIDLYIFLMTHNYYLGPIKKLVILNIKFEGFSHKISKLRKQSLNTLMGDNYLKKDLNQIKNL